VSESPRRFGTNESRILASNTIWKCEREVGEKMVGIQINVWTVLGMLGDARDCSGRLEMIRRLWKLVETNRTKLEA
jgi:hypothetical protein